MTGSKTTMKARDRALRAMTNPPSGGYHEWDGKDEDERPLSAAEMRAGIIEQQRRGRGPGKTPAKTLLSLRLPPAAIDAWKASGPGWQTRMAELLTRRAPKVTARD